jgi:AcrR family transcriptional regulator
MSTDAPKRRLRGTARRALIVDAALEEFAIHGYEAASMGRIGRRAGVTRTVLYDHFPSKRALFAALLEAEHTELLAHLREHAKNIVLARDVGLRQDVLAAVLHHPSEAGVD